jgi:hypothetical protein
LDAEFAGFVHIFFLAVIGLLVYFFPLAIANMRKIERRNYKRVMSPLSSKMLEHRARFSAASCSPVVWSSVLVRA